MYVRKGSFSDDITLIDHLTKLNNLLQKNIQNIVILPLFIFQTHYSVDPFLVPIIYKTIPTN